MPAFASTVGNSALPVIDQLVEPAVLLVEDRGHRRADHQLQREVERALEAGMLGDVLAEQRARLREDAVAQRALGGREHRPQLGIGARRGAQLHRDLEERAGEALPEQAEHGVGPGAAGALLGQLRRRAA